MDSQHVGASKNRGGPPKSWILIGFSIINHPFWGEKPPIFGNTHVDHRGNYQSWDSHTRPWWGTNLSHLGKRKRNLQKCLRDGEKLVQLEGILRWVLLLDLQFWMVFIVHPQNLIHKTLLFLLAWAAGLVGNVHTWGIPRITNQQALTHKSKAWCTISISVTYTSWWPACNFWKPPFTQGAIVGGWIQYPMKPHLIQQILGFPNDFSPTGATWDTPPETGCRHVSGTPLITKCRIWAFSLESQLISEANKLCTQEVQFDQTLPLGSRESFTWIILKTILCLVLDFQGVHKMM